MKHLREKIKQESKNFAFTQAYFENTSLKELQGMGAQKILEKSENVNGNFRKCRNSASKFTNNMPIGYFFKVRKQLAAYFSNLSYYE